LLKSSPISSIHVEVLGARPGLSSAVPET
jgi:hypothetical protein